MSLNVVIMGVELVLVLLTTKIFLFGTKAKETEHNNNNNNSGNN